MIIKINGDIVPNDYKEMYEWFGMECATPADVENALASMPEGDVAYVHINSGGGDVFSGQQIYTMLRSRKNVEIVVESIAASAASVIAMAGHSVISPVGMVMIHNVSTVAAGNKNDLKKEAKVLDEFDNALASAYIEKTGKDRAEILALMDKETWLPANKAVELGFIDEIQTSAGAAEGMVAAIGGLKVTEEMMSQFKAHKKREEEKKKILEDIEKFGA